jgi:hypothetical protein
VISCFINWLYGVKALLCLLTIDKSSSLSKSVLVIILIASLVALLLVLAAWFGLSFSISIFESSSLVLIALKLLISPLTPELNSSVFIFS